MFFRIFSLVFAFLSIWAAYLQLNDPDPIGWACMYLASAVLAGLVAFNQKPKKLALALAAVTLIWALTIVPQLIGTWTPKDLAGTMAEDHPEIELGRELGGLLIVAAFSLTVFAISYRKDRTLWR